ncbi:MAG: type II toxin-antitoxin system VapC family toxin [Candidatus Latescibacteria bacterium]|nr:type II toxin-antitoxin system VapC family toxin [Candidatus Latescibacterota bacterium]MCK5382029.1 type II toxin-antitoxin system VapC family toxin [Candidatus Latescibacterota bacterium]MCK5527411.1 type II toxin-antitoxin system VapC family toxin [Candidatus Latescibacterota bacterium]
MTEVFLDAAYAIALSAPNDQYHDRAERFAEQLEAEGTRLITTRAVVLEIGNALAKLRNRSASVELMSALEEDPKIEIVPISELLYRRAFHLYRERPDKEWGITDCISFIVMQNRGLTEALTTDEHFQQAGFRALLRES